MMEKVPESREETSLTMERFRQEMRTLVIEELRKKAAWEAARERGEEGEPYSDDAVNIRVEDLTESDRAIWEQINGGNVTAEAYQEYDGLFREERAALVREKRHPEVKKDIQKSRDSFHAVAADRVQLIIDKKVLERETREQSLEVFRQEMRVLKAEEMRKKTEWEARGRQGPAYDPHWDTIDPDHLGEYERRQWRVEQTRGLTRQEFEDYDRELAEGSARLRSREDFRALIANSAAKRFMREELAEQQKPPPSKEQG